MQASKGQMVNAGAGLVREMRVQLAIGRHIWNHFLALNSRFYEREKRFIFYNEMSANLTRIRGHGIFSDGIAGAGHQKLMDLERAIKDSFPNANNRRGFPNFKKASHQCDSIRVQAKEVRLVRSGDVVTHVVFPKMSPMRVKGMSIPLGSKINSFTLSMHGGKFYVSAQFEAPVAARQLPSAPTIVGVDMGLHDVVALSTGVKIAPMRPYAKLEKRLKRAQRKLSRKHKGSINARRERKKVDRIHARIGGLRRNHQHHVSRAIVDQSTVVGLEDLNIAGMRKGHLGKSVSDVAMGEIRRQITYKAEWHGRMLYVHPRFARSTGCCPDCQMIGPKLNRSTKTWTCGVCGVRHDRDVAAARWIALCASMVGIADPEPVKVMRSQSPKRGPAGTGKRAPSGVRARPGPPSNVPDGARLRASTG